MVNPNNIDPETQISDPVSMKTKIIIGVLVLIAFATSYFIGETIKAENSQKKSVSLDARKATIDSLIAQKKENEKKIEELKNKNYDLDQKIVPLKCGIYSEVGAKDTWEAECRESHEEQKQKILSQEEEQVDSAVVPDYQ